MLPLVNTITRLVAKPGLSKWLMASTAAVAFAAPAVVKADPRGGRVDRHEVERRETVRHEVERHDFDHHDRHVEVDVHLGARPEFEDRQVSVWVPPVYRTETQQVWVPDQFQDRQVRYLDRGQWCTRIDHVLVVPGHYETRETQVCVTEGHYETHVEHVRVAEPLRDPVTVINPALGGFDLHVGR